MNTILKTGTKGIELIKNAEGLRLETYADSIGKLTIGWGHTRNVKPGQVITEAEAETLLQSDLKPCEDLLNSLDLNLNQNQFDACVSFIFNLGSGKFLNSTLYREIKVNPSDPDIAYQFKRWVYGGGKVLPGLVSRRLAESLLYFEPI